MSLSREHVTHALYINMLYDVELYILKSNKIYVILCYVLTTYMYFLFCGVPILAVT